MTTKRKTQPAPRNLRSEEHLHGLPPMDADHPDGLPLGGFLEGVPVSDEAGRRLRLDQVLEARQDVGLNLAPETQLERALTALAPPMPTSPRRVR